MSSKLQLVKPLAVTDSNLTSNVLENDFPAWSAATAYAVGDRVIRTTTHRVYQRATAGTTATAPESDPANWTDLGATNRWRMFDQSNTTQSTRSPSIEVSIVPGQVVNAVGLVGLIASTVRVQMIDPLEGTVYDQTVDLQAPPASASWYEYFFDPIKARTSATFTELPSYRGATITITITITAASGDAACASCIVGRTVTIGDGIHQGARIGIADYSRKDTNEFGDTVLVQRRYAKRSNLDVLILNADLDYIQNALAEVRATPTLWIGGTAFDALVIFGFYKDFSITIAYPNYAQCSLEIEGLT